MTTYSEWHISDKKRRIEVYYQAIELLVWEKKLEDDKIYSVFDDFDDYGKWIKLDKFHQTQNGFLIGYKNVASDERWPNKTINNFADYFDLKPSYYKTVKRPIIVQNEKISDLIIDYAIRLDEYYGIANNDIEIIRQYDIVPTKYGPSILTSYNYEEIKYVTKALYYLINEKSSSFTNLYVKSKCLDYFKMIDDTPVYED